MGHSGVDLAPSLEGRSDKDRQRRLDRRPPIQPKRGLPYVRNDDPP